MTPVGGRPSRRLRGRDAPGLLDVTCFCGLVYEVPVQLVKKASCPHCRRPTRDIPEGR
jgi:hypothetical protein